MGYEPRTFQSTTSNTPPTGTDPMVDNTANGDVQAIKLINPTAGSVAPWIDQALRAQSLPVALSVEDAALLGTLLTNTTFNAKIPALGQALAAASIPVTLANDGVFAINHGLIADAAASSDTGSFSLISLFKRLLSKITTQLPTALGAGGGLKVDGSGTALPVSNASLPLPTGASTAAKQPALGTAGSASADVITVQGIASGTVLPIKASRSSAATKANVSASASSVTILALNTNRLGASIYNDSSAILYLDTSGGTATSTSHTLAMAANSYFELPFNLTGLITGIWANATGAARIVEYT